MKNIFKSLKIILPVIICILIFSGCTKDIIEETEAITETEENIYAGTWQVEAAEIDGKLIYLNDYPKLKDLYDSVFLNIEEDKSFTFYQFFFYSGTYTEFSDSEIILKADKQKVYENGEFTEKECKKEINLKIEMLDENTLRFTDNQAESKNDEVLYFVRQGCNSDYIIINKSRFETIITTIDETLPSNEKHEATEYDMNTYEGIYAFYKDKMKKATPALVREYNNEASGISDIESLAEICNNKIGELAEISNSGIEEMAELMHKNNDSYSLYEKWAGKLQEAYSDYAKEISNAYMNSAVY